MRAANIWRTHASDVDVDGMSWLDISNILGSDGAGMS